MSFSEWNTYQLGELLEVKYGKDHKSLVEGKIPVYGSGGIMRYVDKAIYGEVSILIPRKGSLNNIYFLDKPFWTVDTMFWTKINKKLVDPKFLYYKLTTFNYSDMNVGSAVPSMTVPVLNEMEIVAPALKTQSRIASILSSLDDKIELNRQTNQTLEEMAQALFQEMCVPKNGELPEGWSIEKLGEVCETKGGTTPSTTKKEYWDGEFYWTSPRDLSNLQTNVLLDTSRKITAEGVKQISSGILPKGTLLLSSRAPIGYLVISEVPISINQGFIAINGTKVSNLFILYWLKQNMQTIIGNANGSTFLEISKSVFRNIEITIPSTNVLEKFEEIISGIYNQILNNEKENQTLSAIRNSLLPKLMKGEIEINHKFV